MTHSPITPEELGEWLSALEVASRTAHQNEKQKQKDTACQFSALDLLVRGTRKIKIYERKISEIIRYLLDPQERHGQETFFLQTFLEELKLDIPDVALHHYDLILESQTTLIENSRRFVDISIQSEKLILFIENKPAAALPKGQLIDYRDEGRKIAEPVTYSPHSKGTSTIF